MKTLIIITIAINLMTISNNYAQNSPYDLYIDKIVKTAPNKIEFDIMIKSKDATKLLNYKGGQYFINFNSNVKNGGNLSVRFIIGSSDLDPNRRPRNPKILKDNIIGLATNSFSGNNVNVISSINPVRIYRIELSTSAESFKWTEEFKFGWEGNDKFKTKIFNKAPGDQSEDVTDPANHKIKSTKIENKIVKQGERANDTSAARRKNLMEIIIRSATSPYNVIESKTGFLDSLTFRCSINFETLQEGTYYIVLKNFQSIETWSKAGGEFISPDTVSYFYDFTSSNDQAFGSNMIYDKNLWAIYNGDVNQDGVIDAADIVITENDAYNFLQGYNVVTDINGDMFVDAFDLMIVDNNASNFVASITP